MQRPASWVQAHLWYEITFGFQNFIQFPVWEWPSASQDMPENCWEEFWSKTEPCQGYANNFKVKKDDGVSMLTVVFWHC